MATLTGHHALITGGGSGIGLACAAAFLADGAAVTLVGRSKARLEAGRASLHAPDRTHVATADIAEEDAIAAVIAAAHERLPLTIVVANAGAGGAAPLLQTQGAAWRAVIDTNLNGTFYTLRYGAAALASGDGGALCAVSSIAGLRTHRLMSAYCSSKAAIDMLVRNAADELGAHGIRVNSVCPGLVETELSAGLHEHEAMRADYLTCMPLARTGQPEDVAAAVRYLCGPEASWLTGVNLPVDGGHHLRRGPDLSKLIPT